MKENDKTVVAIGGIASLFGLVRASALIEAVAPSIQGRLLIFFPGRRDGSIYRLLDARDSWNYLAIPIEAANIESLLQEYENFVKLPWDPSLAGPQKVWFAIYDPAQERRLRLWITEFEMATLRAGYGWKFIDLTDSFAHWMAQHEYREAYFEQPEDMELALQDFSNYLVEQVKSILEGSSIRN